MATNSLQSIALMAGVATNGMTIYAYHAGRFALPARDAAVPDGNPADAGPFTSGNDPVYGDGFWSGTVGDQNPYYFTALGGDGHTYWLGPVTPVVSTTQQGYSASIDQTANRDLGGGSIASSSNGVSLPSSSIQMTPAGTVPTSGTVAISTNTGYSIVTYTGRTGPVSGVYTLTGCSGGSGTLTTGAIVIVLYQNSFRRRTVVISAQCQVQQSGDYAYMNPFATVAGRFEQVPIVGFQNYLGAVLINLSVLAYLVVDPFGYYGVVPDASVAAHGSVGLNQWIETDG